MIRDFLIKYLVFYNLGASYNFFNNIKRFKHYKTYNLMFINISGKILYIISTKKVEIIIIIIKGKRR